MIQYIIAGAIGFVVAKLLEEDEAPKYTDGGSVNNSDYTGNYRDLRDFINSNNLQDLFVDNYKKYVSELNKDNWEDYTYGELGYDEEIISSIMGKNYKIFYDEENDEFVITKKKLNKISFEIILSTKKYNDRLIKVIEDNGVYTKYKPRYVVLVKENVIGGSTFEIDDNNIYHFDLAIDEEYQGYGIAKKLIDKIVRDAENLKAKQIQAYVVNNVLFEYLKNSGWNVSKDGGEKYAWKQIRTDNFEKGGSTLLAPNGKPSNLTPEQYKLVRTNEFKAWFGDWENDPNHNMLIDKNGEPMIWWHTGGDWTKLNNDGINGKGKLMFSPTKSSMAYGRDGEQTITRPFFIKSDFIYMLPYEYRDTPSAYRWNKNKKNPIWFVNAYGGFIVVRQSNQIKLADGTNTTFDGNNPDIRFEMGGKTFEYTQSKVGMSRRFIPSVRGGWTKEKIIKYLKSRYSDIISTYRLVKYISEFDNWQEFKEHIFYHGTSNTIDKGLKPSITMSEREAERSGGGGYGDRYFGISLTSRKRTAESFSGMSNGVTIYPVILKRDAVVIERTDLKDASEVEDIIIELYEQGVDAVWIGGGEEELVVVNPYSVLLYEKGSERHSVFGGFKSIPLTDEKIKEIYDNSLILWETYLQEYSKKENKEDRDTYFRSLPKIQFNNGGEITTYTEFYDNLQIEDGSKYIGQKFSEIFPFLGRRKTPNDFRIDINTYYGILKRIKEDNYSTQAMKQTDLNKLKRSKSNIDKKKYLAKFYLDSQGVIVKFVK